MRIDTQTQYVNLLDLFYHTACSHYIAAHNYDIINSVLGVLDICQKKFLKFSAWTFADKKPRDLQPNHNKAQIIIILLLARKFVRKHTSVSIW